MLRRTLARQPRLNTGGSRLVTRRWAHEGPGGPSPDSPPGPQFREGQPKQGSKALGFLAVFGLSAGAAYYFYPNDKAAPAKPEKPKKKIAKAETIVVEKKVDGPVKGNRDYPGV